MDYCYSSFNNKEDLLLIVLKVACQIKDVTVYDLTNKKRISIPYDPEQEWQGVEMISTAKQNLVFVCDKVSTILKVYSIEASSQNCTL